MPAQPFWPMVEPNEAAKLAMPSGVPRRWVCVCTLIGIEPALVRDVNAKASTGKTFFTKRSGFSPTPAMMARCTRNINISALYEATTKLISFKMSV